MNSHSLNFCNFLTFKLQADTPTLIFSFRFLLKICEIISFFLSQNLLCLKLATYFLKTHNNIINLENFIPCNSFIFNLILVRTKRDRIFLYIFSNFKCLAKLAIFICLPSFNGIVTSLIRKFLIK